MMKAWIAALTLLLGTPALAEPQRGTFDLLLKGTRAGLLTFRAETEGARYTASATLESAGMLALARTIRYEMAASGGVEGTRLRPALYREEAQRGKRKTSVQVSWPGGVPQLDRHEPPRATAPWDIDPASQSGTLDPLSALAVALRDTAPGAECRLTLEIFDGRKRDRLTLGAPEPAGRGVRCAGEYRRIAGYSPEDMAEKPAFALSFRYVPTEEGRMRVVEISTDTIWGPARLTRR